jgi:F-type H+-transporting ATPase subunit epsilon
MADNKIAFDLVSPERLLLSEEAEMVTVPGLEGEMGVMAGHMPLITALRPGIIDVKGGTEGHDRFFVTAGFAEVTPAKITVLAEEAIPLASLTATELDQRIIDAEEDISLAKTDTEMTRAVAALDNLKRMRAAL